MRMSGFAPEKTWPSFVGCIAFQGVVYFLCFHPRGPEQARRGPTLLGRWIKRREEDSSSQGYAASTTEIRPPVSVAQTWRLGALHERYFNGAGLGEESVLEEAGEVFGQSLTEEEFALLASVAERAVHGSRSSCCNFSDCLFVSGILGATITILPAIYFLTTPIHPALEQLIDMAVSLLRQTPLFVLCLITLTLSLALVCDGFRAVDRSLGGRIALSGVLGGVASLYYSTRSDDPWSGFLWISEEQTMVLFGFAAVTLLPIAVKFDLSLGGFLAAISAGLFGLYTSLVFSWTQDSILGLVAGSLIVDVLFILAILCGVSTRKLQPFSAGVMATGVFSLHLELLFLSNEVAHSFWRGHSTLHHMLFQLPLYASLATGWVLGKHIGCKGLTNNTRLFGFLYAFITIISVSYHLTGPGGSSVGWAIVSLGVWRVGLYLHKHRDFLSSLWTLDAGHLRFPNFWLPCSFSGRTCNHSDSDIDGDSHSGTEMLLGEGSTLASQTGRPRQHRGPQ